MTFNDMLRREAHVVVHGQTARFRLVKYAILIPLFVAIGLTLGWDVMWTALVVALAVAIAIHLLFRWKTKAWTQSWGPYKKIELPR